MTASKATKFPGFPPNTLRFLSNLKRHNNREWFQENKQAYERDVRLPMEQLIDALALEFPRVAPDMVASRKASLYRIYRDTRFSRDKTPYKTHVAAVFPARGLDKHEGAAFYIQFSPAELLIGGGLYMPLPEGLTAVREHIATHVDRLEKILKARAFRRVFSRMSGEQLTRTPRGYSPEHPAATYLRHKQFLAGTTLPGPVVTTPRFYPVLLDAFQALYPFIQFLNEAIVKNKKRRLRQDELLGRRQ